MIKNQQIAHALALLKLRNFRKAAHDQNISQPAFSRSIAKLEESLGVQLFHRHPSGVTETVYGQILQKYGGQIIAATAEFEREIRITQGLGTGELCVALGPYPAELTGHRAVGRLVSEYPELHCKIVVSDWYEVEKMVVSRSADLGLAELSVADKNEHLKIEPIGKHRFVLYCRSGHPILGKSRVLKNDLDHYPVVLIKLPIRMGHVFPGKFFPEENTSNMIPSVEIQDLALSRQIVAESDAISAATPYQIENELENGTLSVIPFAASWMNLNYGFIYLKDRALSPVATKYMSILKELETDVDQRNSALIEKYLPS
jgi:DNA-binding transcriptional LysR family regulator